jgi:hypothetical protein
MIAKTYTCSRLGIDAILVEVEVDPSPGLPTFAKVNIFIGASHSRMSFRRQHFTN